MPDVRNPGLSPPLSLVAMGWVFSQNYPASAGGINNTPSTIASIPFTGLVVGDVILFSWAVRGSKGATGGEIEIEFDQSLADGVIQFANGQITADVWRKVVPANEIIANSGMMFGVCSTAGDATIRLDGRSGGSDVGLSNNLNGMSALRMKP